MLACSFVEYMHNGKNGGVSVATYSLISVFTPKNATFSTPASLLVNPSKEESNQSHFLFFQHTIFYKLFKFGSIDYLVMPLHSP